MFAAFQWPHMRVDFVAAACRPPKNLDTVRGLACLLLVAFHVVGTPGRGLRLPDTSDWHYAMASFELVRMPIFTILSGFLYGQRRAEFHQFGAFAFKKFKRLGLPLFSLTVLTVAVRHVVYGDSADIITAMSHSYEHFWFLQALLILFGMISLIDCIWMPDRRSLLLLTLGAALLSSVGWDHGTFFSIPSAVYLLPFFLFGLTLSQWPDFLTNRLFVGAAIAVAMVTLFLHQLGLTGILPDITRTSLIGFACGAASCVVLLRFLPKIKSLHTIGHYSYSIYLWHVMFLAAVRLALFGVGIKETFIIFLGSLAAGIVGPVFLHRSLKHMPYVSPFLFGTTQARRARSQTRHSSPQGFGWEEIAQIMRDASMGFSRSRRWSYAAGWDRGESDHSR